LDEYIGTELKAFRLPFENNEIFLMLDVIAVLRSNSISDLVSQSALKIICKILLTFSP
jgi:hypothetical protein